MKLSIIIVNRNTKNLLKKCLKSIYSETKNIDFEVFVVDNASQDGSIEMVEKEFCKSGLYPDIHLIQNKKNLGFARANNQAIRKSRGEYILLLNPDTQILNQAIEKSISFLDTRLEIGILGCKLLNPDGSIQPSCRTYPTFLSQAIILLKLHNLFPKFLPIRKYYMLDFDHCQAREVDQVMGAFFLIRKKVIDEIGLLDEKYWIWFEEVDFCRRARKAGWKIYFWPKAQIIHQKAASFDQVCGLKKQFWLNRSMLRYFRKFESPFAFFFILCLYPISISLAGAVDLIRKIKPLKKKKYL